MTSGHNAHMSPRPSVEIQRREAVLRATWELISEVGHARVRIVDIARRVGTSTATVHYYFKTKDDVLAETFRFAVADSRRRSEAAVAGIDDPWDRLVALLEAHLPRQKVAKEWLIWLELWNEARVQPSLRTLNARGYGHWIDLVEGIVQDGQERSTFRPVPARDFVLRLLTMMDGIAIQHAMGSRQMTVSRARALLLGFAREQLLGTGAGA